MPQNHLISEAPLQTFEFFEIRCFWQILADPARSGK